MEIKRVYVVRWCSCLGGNRHSCVRETMPFGSYSSAYRYLASLKSSNSSFIGSIGYWDIPLGSSIRKKDKIYFNRL